MPPTDETDLVTVLRDGLQRAGGCIAAAWLFGSQARGTARANSDVDVGVLYGVPPDASSPGGPFGLEGELERLVRKPVQVVVMNRAPVDLVHRVLRDGILLLANDHAARIQFEVRSRNEYFDLLPYLRRYRRRA